MFLFTSMRDLHEHLAYVSKPEDKNAISKIQLYLNYYLTYCKLVNALDNAKSAPVFTLKINLKINDVTYTEKSERLVDAISQLAEADGFELDVRYFGRTGDISSKISDGTLIYLDVADNSYGMFEYLEKSSDRNLVYKMMAYYENQDEFISKYIDINGCINDYHEEIGTVIETGNSYELCLTNNLSVLASFDFEQYPAQADSIKKLVSKCFSDDFNELWDEGEYVGFADLSEGLLKLEDLVDFADDFNEVVSEIDDETLNIIAEGVLYDLDKFVVVKPFCYAEENKIKFLMSESED